MSAVTSRCVQALIRPSIMASSTPRARKAPTMSAPVTPAPSGVKKTRLVSGDCTSIPAICDNPRASARALGVVARKPVDMVVEGVDAGGRANAGLAHRAAQPLLPAPDLVDEIA